jgi:hypothetical protein
MFNKNKKIIPEPATSQEVSSPDLIIHNMPSPAKLSGTGFSRKAPVSSSASLIPSAAGNNFKTVGLLIIVLGLVVIGAIVYLSYRFIIKPTAGQPNAPVTITATSSEAETKINAPVAAPILTPPADLSTATPAILDLAATTSSSTEIVMNEESSGRDGSNLPPLLDSDNDGLGEEEETVLGTSPVSADSNGNGYPDLVEVNNNYNPAGTGRLDANGNLTGYDDKVFGYHLLSPKIWPVSSLNNDATTVFTAPDDSLIQISVQDNPDKASILSWYEESFPEETVGYDRLKTADTWDGIMGRDNLNFYLVDKDHKNILVISYIPAVSGRLTYPNIFRLMINSLAFR